MGDLFYLFLRVKNPICPSGSCAESKALWSDPSPRPDPTRLFRPQTNILHTRWGGVEGGAAAWGFSGGTDGVLELGGGHAFAVGAAAAARDAFLVERAAEIVAAAGEHPGGLDGAELDPAGLEVGDDPTEKEAGQGIELADAVG